MIILDAYALLAYLRDEAAAGPVADLLASPTAITSVNAAEVLDQLVRVHGKDADDVHGDLAILGHAGMNVLDVTSELGISAGRLRARHYHRTGMPVSLADCVAAAAALSTGSALATADAALANVVRAEGGKVSALPDSRGRLP